jgi:hypothetical protein
MNVTELVIWGGIKGGDSENSGNSGNKRGLKNTKREEK